MVSRVERQKRIWAFGFIAPAFVVYTVFLLYPILASLPGSLYKWSGLVQGEFVGFGNFAKLFSDLYAPRLLGAFKHNALWFFGIILIQNLIAFYFAYLIHLRVKGYRLFQTLYFVPAMLSPIVVGALWKLLLNPMGPITKLVGLFGGSPLPWLGLENYALLILILIDCWNWIGFPLLIFVAALNDIPPSVLEAAELDGVSGLRKIIHIILPLVIPAVSVTTVLTFINTFNTFDLVYVMQGVQGNPNYATDVLNTLFYRLAFGSQGGAGITDIGLAFALATLMFLFLTLGVGILLKLFAGKEVKF